MEYLRKEETLNLFGHIADENVAAYVRYDCPEFKQESKARKRQIDVRNLDKRKEKEDDFIERSEVFPS